MNIVATTTVIDGVTFTVNSDKSVTITGSQNNPSAHTRFVLCNYTATSNLILYAPESVSNKYFVNTQDGVTSTNGHPEGIEITGSDIGTARDYQIVVIAGTSNINVTMHPMIIPKDVFNDGFKNYQPYALSNVDLTTLSEQNKTNILSAYGGVVNKNVAKINDVVYTASQTVVAYTIPCAPISGNITLSIGTVSSTDTDATTCAIVLYYTDSTDSSLMQLSRGNNIVNNYDINKTLDHIDIYPSDSFEHGRGDTLTISDLMVCSQANYTADPTYQPYALSNVDLTSSTKIKTHNFSAANTLENTGLSFTAGAWTTYLLTASISWSSGEPLAILLSSASDASSVSRYNTYAISEVTTGEGKSLLTCIALISNINSSGTYNCFVKNASATGKSTITLSAMRIL